MNRRLTLLVGSLAALLLLLAGYWVSVRDEQDSPWRRQPRPYVDTPAGEPVTLGGIETGSGTEGKIVQYTKDHRLKAVYRYERLDKMGDKIYLKAPCVEWYLRHGELVRISAREGRITAEEIGGKIDVREGELIGDVWIVLDRSAAADRTPLEQRPDDAVRIHVNEVRFDNELLMIDSDSHVTVFSREVDILGKGLRIAWTEGPRRLRQMRIDQGGYMCIREGQEGFIGETLLPGGERSQREPATSPAEPAGPEGAAPAQSWPGAGAAPLALVQAALATTATTPAAAPASMSASAPAGSGTPGPPPVVPDTYQATLTGDVRVNSGQRRIRGVDELTLVFNYSPPGRRSGDVPAALTLPQPASSPTGPADQPPTTQPVATQPDQKPKPTQPLFVTWDGPLVLKPFRSDEQPPADQEPPKRLDVAGTGREVELIDGGTRAVCESFKIHSRSRPAGPHQPDRGQDKLTVSTGELLGSEARPVKLTLAGGERITVPRVQFDRDSGLANFYGAGTMRLPDAADAAADQGPAPQSGLGLEIAWKERVIVSFGERRIETDMGRRRREYLRSADFFGEVDVRHGLEQRLQTDQLVVKFREPVATDTAVNRADSLHATGSVQLTDADSGDFVNSRKLDVQLTTDPTGRTVPSTAVATGSVRARQDTATIAADSVTVTFGPDSREQADRAKVRPMTLDAVGNVKLTDFSDAKRQIEPNTIQGDRIILDRKAEMAKVIGPGQLRFYSHTDISGTRSEKPRPVDIGWAKGMEFSGKDQTVDATGKVNLVTAGDTMRCEKMHVKFLPRQQESATRPAPRRELDQFRAQRIATVKAQQNVRLESVRKDDKGFLLRRVMLLSPESVHYDVPAETLTCPAPGTLSVEDYRPPKTDSRDEARDAVGGGKIVRPSQSAFSWTESMKMDQKQRTVNMAGNVKMAHCSGDQVVLADKLNVAPWTKLPEGRKTMLACDTMLARFAKPDQKAAPAADALGGPQLGPLEMFDAGGKKSGVNLVDGPWQVLCRQIEYRGDKDIATIWGSLPGEQLKDAVIYYDDREKRTLNTWKSPKIIWYRSNNRVETKGIEVRGGR